VNPTIGPQRTSQGFRVAIDDLGAGERSLAVLLRQGCVTADLAEVIAERARTQISAITKTIA
jgi:EAL domain-containing protein (putative c-di-GMP-specific phosphodiesterase class I)